MSRQKPLYAAKIYIYIFPRTTIRSEKPKIFTRAKLEENWRLQFTWCTRAKNMNGSKIVILQLSKSQAEQKSDFASQCHIRRAFITDSLGENMFPKLFGVFRPTARWKRFLINAKVLCIRS